MATPAKPHLVFFPFPAQGHVTPAFQLATLLHQCHGFDVTFVHTELNRRRLLRARKVEEEAAVARADSAEIDAARRVLGDDNAALRRALEQAVEEANAAAEALEAAGTTDG